MAGPFDPIPGTRGTDALTLIAEQATVAALEELRGLWHSSDPLARDIDQWPGNVRDAYHARRNDLMRSGSMGKDCAETQRIIAFLRERQAAELKRQNTGTAA